MCSLTSLKNSPFEARDSLFRKLVAENRYIDRHQKSRVEPPSAQVRGSEMIVLIRR